MNYIVPTITKTLMFHTINYITEYISTIHTLFTYITTHNNTDYQIYQIEIEKSDINNKLLLIESLIKSIIKKYNCNNYENITTDVIEYELIDNDINKLIKGINLPDPLKISLISTFEIIQKIHNILESIHDKMVYHNKSFSKYIYKLNIHNDIEKFINYNDLFDTRINIFFSIIKLYNINL
jgi:hypothetical protein